MKTMLRAFILVLIVVVAGCYQQAGKVYAPVTSSIPPVSSGAGDQTASSHTLQPTPMPQLSFPGVAPVVFSQVARAPMRMNVPVIGATTPNGDEVLGFTFSADAGDVLDMSLARLSGNLNLGVVVLSARDEALFVASVLTSEKLTSQFSLPADGVYTIVVFRTDLKPTGAPAVTAFELQSKLIPRDAAQGMGGYLTVFE